MIGDHDDTMGCIVSDLSWNEDLHTGRTAVSKQYATANQCVSCVCTVLMLRHTVDTTQCCWLCTCRGK